MKKLIVLLIVTFGIFACKGVLAPDPVHKAFIERYKNAKDVKWEQEDNNWEAEFDLGNIHMEAVFNENGQWLETEWDINMMDLPTLVRDSIAIAYKDYKVEEINRFETPGFKGYLIVVEKGKVEIELTANEQEIIKSTEEVDDETEEEDDEDHNEEGHDHDGDDHDHDDGVEDKKGDK